MSETLDNMVGERLLEVDLLQCSHAEHHPATDSADRRSSYLPHRLSVPGRCFSDWSCKRSIDWVLNSSIFGNDARKGRSKKIFSR